MQKPFDSFEIIGGTPLCGEITPQGAKNEALQVISAVLLTPHEIIIENIPNIADVNQLIDILAGMGVKVKQLEPHTYSFKADDIDTDYLYSPVFQERVAKLRGAVMVVGPLLARYKKAHLPRPGGDKIGRRRLDTHFWGLQALGANFNYNDTLATFEITAPQLKGNYVTMEEISVTGTANVLMAAVYAQGQTTIYNAACEPYLQQLCRMLNSMGANIQGIGSNMLVIQGIEKLHGCTHRILPDMIEVGSFIGLAALTQSSITIKNAGIQHLGVIPQTFAKLGIQIEARNNNNDLHIPAQKNYEIQKFIDGSILTIYDAPWPGFTPDLLSILLVVATQAKGSVLIHQKMFESRLFFVDKLIDMGAQIILCDPHRAVVIGINREYALRGVNMASPDIRAGMSLLMAALSANGKSTISQIEQIDRGYQNLDQRLMALGANIKRV